MQDVYEFLGDLSNLSSDGLIGSIFELLEVAGGWADNVAKLLGLLG